MAQVIPDGWREYATTGAAGRKIETLERLERTLPASYTVYHGVHWTLMARGQTVFGEVDFIVINRAGDLLLIEQKSGFLEESPDGLQHRQGERRHSLPLQLARNRAALQTRLAARPGCRNSHIDSLFYCPDHTVRHPQIAGIPPERIVDARRAGELEEIIQEVLPETHQIEAAREVHRFLRDILQLETDVSALIGQARQLVTRVSGGLSHWARQLEFTPYRLRVTGTAGSGKTQLALAEYAATLNAGRRPLYLCFNRPLADHFQYIAPPGGVACTLHMLCDQRLRARGVTPDFTRPDAFERLLEQATALPVDEAWRFDTVIVDEGQDFTEAWKDLALSHAKPESRMLWLEDPLQNLYLRHPVPLPGWVSLHAKGNYRSPHDVVRLLQPLLPQNQPIEAKSPLRGSGVPILVYRDLEELTAKTKEAIRLCLGDGFRKNDLALVSFSGRENSRLFALPQLGPHTLKTFTGRYDLLGQPLYTPGDVLLESVYRFKGQAAPAIVFTEIDFETLDERSLRKLFVGATRAMMKLVLVVSARAAEQLTTSETGERSGTAEKADPLDGGGARNRNRTGTAEAEGF